MEDLRSLLYFVCCLKGVNCDQMTTIISINGKMVRTQDRIREEHVRDYIHMLGVFKSVWLDDIHPEAGMNTLWIDIIHEEA